MDLKGDHQLLRATIAEIVEAYRKWGFFLSSQDFQHPRESPLSANAEKRAAQVGHYSTPYGTYPAWGKFSAGDCAKELLKRNPWWAGIKAQASLEAEILKEDITRVWHGDEKTVTLFPAEETITEAYGGLASGIAEGVAYCNAVNALARISRSHFCPTGVREVWLEAGLSGARGMDLQGEVTFSLGGSRKVFRPDYWGEHMNVDGLLRFVNGLTDGDFRFYFLEGAGFFTVVGLTASEHFEISNSRPLILSLPSLGDDSLETR